MDNLMIIRLKANGPLHPGREDEKIRIKRCWPFILGSTFYGAMVQSFLQSKFGYGIIDSTKVKKGLKFLLEPIKNGALRFSPFLPCSNLKNCQWDEFNADNYCQLAREIGQVRSWTSAHHTRHRVNSDRPIEGELFAREFHQANLEYVGFVYYQGNNGYVPEWVSDYVKLLTLVPFGGKGGNVSVSASVAKHHSGDLSGFFEQLDNRLDNRLEKQNDCWIEAVTPVSLGFNDDKVLSDIPSGVNVNNGYRICKSRIYRDTPWRWGPYLKDGDIKEFKKNTRDSFVCYRPGFRYKVDWNKYKKTFQEHFLRGIGNSDHTYLGYGQVIV